MYEGNLRIKCPKCGSTNKTCSICKGKEIAPDQIPLNPETGEMKETSTMSKIKVIPTSRLYLKYDGQTQPQPCHIELNCQNDGKILAEYNPEIGNAVPTEVYYGHIQRWRIPCLKEQAADDLIQDLLPLAEKIVAGYNTEWDGNNYSATFTDEAKAAIEEIESVCYDLYIDESNGDFGDDEEEEEEEE